VIALTVTALADIERAVRERRDFSCFETAYLHRAWQEDAWGRIRGRDRIRDAAIAAAAEEAAGPVRIDQDLGDMIAFTTVAGWRGHRWAIREGGLILGDIAVTDGAARAEAIGRTVAEEAVRLGAAAPLHAPLGELRAGRGQLASGDLPDLPPGFPDAAHPAASWLHTLWNARAFDRAAPDWRGPAEAGGDGTALLLGLIAAMPDAVLLIERAIVTGDRVAILWRLHGHQAGAARVRAIGSSVLTLAGDDVVAEDMMIDTLAMRATAHRPVIDYSR
jgi:hypothetical protein